MTVAELITELQKYPPDMPVKVFNTDNATHHEPTLTRIDSWANHLNYEDIQEQIVEIS